MISAARESTSRARGEPEQVKAIHVSAGYFRLLAPAGVLAGALASLALARYMATLVYGVKPIDPAVMTVSCGILGLVAALASYFPPAGQRGSIRRNPCDPHRYRLYRHTSGRDAGAAVAHALLRVETGL